MKILKFSWIALMAVVFFACQKDAKDPTLTSEQRGGGAPPPAFVYSAPTFAVGCESSPFSFSASMEKKNGEAMGGNKNSIEAAIYQGGTLVAGLTPSNPQTVEFISGQKIADFTFTGLAAGQYTVIVYFRHANSDNAAVNVPLSFTLTIQAAENCGNGGVDPVCTPDGVTLVRSASFVEGSETGRVVNVSKRYTVHNCSENTITRLKLQGGLVSRASLLSDPVNDGGAQNVRYSQKNNNSNTVLTWTFDLPAGATHTFSVYYSVPGVSCGSPLSGAWSLKNSAGVAIGVAPEDQTALQNGYLDRLSWTCP